MKYLSTLCIFILIPLTGFPQPFDHIFISADNLIKDLDDPDLVILHSGDPEDYTKGHIPGVV